MIVNRQRRVRVSIQPLERFLGRLLHRLRLPAGALTICLVNNNEIARWNSKYRGKNRPTDVLSFPSNNSGKPGRNGQRRRVAIASSSDGPHYLGDIAIAPAIARANAGQFGRSFEDEMRILILHGTLHLMGYDHETDSGQMERFESRLRRELGLG